MIVFRNEINDKIPIDASTAEASLGKVLPKWEQLFDAASSLMGYRLIYPEAVENFGTNDDNLYHIKWILDERLVPQERNCGLEREAPEMEALPLGFAPGREFGFDAFHRL
jgi:hypothetical protein